MLFNTCTVEERMLMKAIIKRVSVALLALVLVASSFTVFSFADEIEPIRFEAETLNFSTTNSEGYTTTVNKDPEGSWAWSLSLGAAQNVSGDLTYFRSGGVGGTVDFEINVEDGGEYALVWAYRPHVDSYCDTEVYINGVKEGGVVSHKAGDYVNDVANTNNYVRTVVMGNANFASGKNTVTIKMVAAKDDDEAYMDKSAFTVDYFELQTPVDESKLNFKEIPLDLDVATKENTTPSKVTIPDGMLDTYDNKAETPKTTDKITVHPLADCYSPSSLYTLKVDGADVPVTTLDGDYEYAAFDYDPTKGAVEIIVEAKTNITKGSVSPDKLGVKAEVSGKTLKATIKECYTYTVYIDGKVLNIAANPMETNVPAKSGAGIFNITEAPYSVTSAMTDKEMTAAIQKALDDASAYGSTKGNKNGVVYIPAGVYKIGSVYISSNTYVYLEAAAALRITNDTSLLDIAATKNSMSKPDGSAGLDFAWWISTSYTEDKEKNVTGSYDIRIGGRGTVDGRDDAYWKTTALGSNSIVPIACSNFTLEGITIRETVCWSVVSVRSNDLTFKWLKIYNRIDRDFENDCIDICESQNVTVTNCIGFSRDDPFSTKCWPYKTGITMRWPGFPEYLDNVTFTDCTAYTGCVGFKVGQGTDQNQYNVTFKECTVLRATIGFGVHCKSGPGTIDTVLFENMYVEDLFGSYDGHSAWIIIYSQANDRGNASIENITVKNIKIRDGEYKGTDEKIEEPVILISGCGSASSVDGVTFTDIYFGDKRAEKLADLMPALKIVFADNIKMHNTGSDAELYMPDKQNTGKDDNKNDTDKNDTDEKNDGESGGSLTVVIVIVVVAVVLAAGAVVAVVVIKKKKTE